MHKKARDSLRRGVDIDWQVTGGTAAEFVASKSNEMGEITKHVCRCNNCVIDSNAVLKAKFFTTLNKSVATIQVQVNLGEWLKKGKWIKILKSKLDLQTRF